MWLGFVVKKLLWGLPWDLLNMGGLVLAEESGKSLLRELLKFVGIGTSQFAD